MRWSRSQRSHFGRRWQLCAFQHCGHTLPDGPAMIVCISTGLGSGNLSRSIDLAIPLTSNLRNWMAMFGLHFCYIQWRCLGPRACTLVQNLFGMRPFEKDELWLMSSIPSTNAADLWWNTVFEFDSIGIVTQSSNFMHHTGCRKILLQNSIDKGRWLCSYFEMVTNETVRLMTTLLDFYQWLVAHWFREASEGRGKA